MTTELARDDGNRYFTDGRSKFIYVCGKFKGRIFKFSTGTTCIAEAKVRAQKALKQWERVDEQSR